MNPNECWLPMVAKPSKTDDPTVSHYFGIPWLALDEKWPHWDGEPMTFVMQLNVTSLPDPIKNLLGGTGLFQLFYPSDNTSGSTWDGEGVLARLVFPEKTLGALMGGLKSIPSEIAKALDERFAGRTDWQHRTITGWKRENDEPHHQEELMGAKEPSEDDDDESNCMQGDKLGGWPFWTQGCERVKRLDNGKIVFYHQHKGKGEDMVPFLQLDAGCFYDGPHGEAYAPELFAGDGTLHVSVLPSDPTIMAVRWACG